MTRLKARCPRCRAKLTAMLELGKAPSCPACGHGLPLPQEQLARGSPVQVCCVCDGAQFYRRRDLPRGLGLIVTASAALMFLILMAVGIPFWIALSVLLATAALDAWMFRRLKEVTVCYRCEAEYRGNRLDPGHRAYDIHLAEQVR